MSSRLHLDSDYSKDNRRNIEALDNELDRFSFRRNQQLFDDSPGKSEMNQFGNFSGSHSQFDPSMSLERGMGEPQRDEDYSFRSKAALAPMSTLSSLSSRGDTPRKTRSEGGNRSGSAGRFDPKSIKKVTALGMHESESEYSPSKFYQPARTPHGVSRMQQTVRKVSPKSFKDTATLFRDLGLEESIAPGETTTMPHGQSFRLPKDVPDLTALLASSRKASHKAINSVPVSDDNQKLFEALRELQVTVDALEQQGRDEELRATKLQKELKRTQDALKMEQQRANVAEKELKQHLTTSTKSTASEAQLKSLETRNETLLKALDAAKQDVELRSSEIEAARDEAASLNEERNRAITRLANALERVDVLTAENEALTKQIDSLFAQLASVKQAPEAEIRLVDEKVTAQVNQRRNAAPIVGAKKKTMAEVEERNVDSDEGIEVSRSVIHESEVEDVTQEVNQKQNKNTKKSIGKAARVSSAANERHEQSRTRKSAHKNGKAQKANVKSKPTTKPQSMTRSTKPRLVLELSEDDTFASGEEEESADETTSEDVSDGEDVNFLSANENEPTQILYRRKPKQQARGKSSARPKVNVHNVINELSRHDEERCTICSRKAAAGQRQSQTQQRSASSGSKANLDDANATIRPSQPPVPALHAVLAGLEDEFRHLKLKYHSLTDEYNKLDPSFSKRKRKTLAADLRTTIGALEGKADQIYAIFDVLEAAATGVPFDDEVAPAVASQVPIAPTRREWIHT